MNNFIDTINFNAATITKKEYIFLSNFLKDKKIRNILEFGPGISTYSFIENSCIIDSIEFSEKWYKEYKNIFSKYNKVNIIYNNFQKEGFIDIPEISNKYYDMVFIDSPPGIFPFSRLNTLLYSFKKSKVILIHDYNRKSEKNSIDILKKIYNFTLRYFDEDKGIGILNI